MTRLHWPAVDFVVRRTMDAAHLNRVANDPAVRPALGGEGVLDLTDRIVPPANLAGVTDHGGFVAVALGDGRYEIHSLFLPDRPSTETVRAMRGAVDYIFASSDAVELVTKVPDDNRPAQGLAQLAGFTPAFRGVLPWTATERKPMALCSLRLEAWALRSAQCLSLGHWLHEQFAAVLQAHASTLPPHSEDDETHERMAGAAALMARAGNPGKAVASYNRWAMVAGYPPIRWLRDHPVVLDLEGIIVELSGDEIEVLACQ